MYLISSNYNDLAAVQNSLILTDSQKFVLGMVSMVLIQTLPHWLRGYTPTNRAKFHVSVM